MDAQKYLERMKNDQNIILDFLENENTTEDDFQDFAQFYNDYHLIKPLLYFLLTISNYHHRTSDFFEKIEKIILILQEKIKSLFTDIEIYNIFRRNNRILLFLLEEKIIKMNESFISTIDYGYFYPEYKKFVDKSKQKEIENELLQLDDDLFTNFEEKRKMGENELYLSELIRKDSVEEFIIYVNKNNLSLSNTKIELSIFETNSFLIENDTPTLIEYAAFFGSIQIFQFLRLNNVDLTPSLWLFAIHGKNPDIIHLLEENRIEPNDRTYRKCIEESIKCHHTDITNYLIDKNSNAKQNENTINMPFCFQFYNFEYFPFYIDDINLMLYYACMYDYFMLVKLLLEVKGIDINYKIV